MAVLKKQKRIKEDEDRLTQLFQQVLQEEFQDLRKELQSISTTSRDYSEDLKAIKKQLDTFIAILKRFSKRQDILEKKLEAIEDYFDPNPAN